MITTQKITEISKNISFIDVTNEEWELDNEKSKLSKQYELCVNDNDNEDYYFNITINIWRTNDEIDYTYIQINSCFDKHSEPFSLTDKQSEVLIEGIEQSLIC